MNTNTSFLVLNGENQKEINRVIDNKLKSQSDRMTVLGTQVTKNKENITVVSAQVADKVNKPTTAVNGRVAQFDASKNVVDSGFTIAKSVPANAEFTDTKYTHPNTTGNKHIPTGGIVGQILKNISNGTAEWGDLPININKIIKGSYNGDGLGIRSIITGVTPKIVIVTRGNTFAISHSTGSGFIANTSTLVVSDGLYITSDGFRVTLSAHLNYSADVYEYTIIY